MSKCPDPDCNAEGEHVGVMRPWKGGPLQVVHQCLRCDGMVWWEDAKNEAAMLVRFNLEPETDLNGDNVCLGCRLALAVDGRNYCRECIEKSTPRTTEEANHE